ncbi:MAG: Lrp/AsnC ligand binding domain-containing protein [Magnetospiraceae bacterium]
MKPVFLLIKCDLGQAYEVADALVQDVEEMSEIYSISGEFDLLAKCYLAPDQDIGRFVNQKIHTVPNIRDTQTLITFNAFT